MRWGVVTFYFVNLCFDGFLYCDDDEFVVPVSAAPPGNILEGGVNATQEEN